MAIKVLVISNYRTVNTARPEAEMLVGLAQQGIDITVMTFGDATYIPRFHQFGIKTIDFHPQKKFNRKEIAFIRAELVRGGYDLMYLFNNKGIYNGLWAAIGLPVKVVLYRGYSGNLDWYDPTAYLKHLHPRVDYIICNSKGVEEMFHRQFFFKKEKTITINKGHDLAWYEGIKPIDRASLGFKDSDFLVACVANVRKMKGVKYLLEGMAMLPKDANIHLLLIGNGMDTPKFRALVAKASNPENIHFLGFQKEPLGIVAASDAFILPSIMGESITKSVLEAMSLGITPIITDIAGNVELVVQNETGLVVPKKNPKALANAMLALYESPSLCKKYGDASRKRIETVLSNTNTVAQTKAFFERITKKATSESASYGN